MILDISLGVRSADGSWVLHFSCVGLSLPSLVITSSSSVKRDMPCTDRRYDTTWTLTIPDFVPIAGSGMLAVSIAFNAMSTHAQCTAVFVVISALITFAAASIQTLGRISWLAWVGTISVFVAGM